MSATENKKSGSCLGAHDIDGYNQLTRMLRPHIDLRSFYFGVRSTLFRLCVPTDLFGTSYTQLTEIEMRREGELLNLEFHPIRKQSITKILYSADVGNEMLRPLKEPVEGGEDKLGGFFNKRFFCPVLFVLEDIIKLKSRSNADFPTLDITCLERGVFTLKREQVGQAPDLKWKYPLFRKTDKAIEEKAESITVFLEPPQA